MNQQRRVDWAGNGNIRFEGESLPHYAKYFYVCMLPDSLPEDVCEWTMDLRYCWGRKRRSESALILKACKLLEHQINSQRQALFTHMKSLRPDSNPDEVCQEFLQSIQIMRRHAERITICQWTMQPMQGEVEKALSHCLAVMHEMERAQQKRVLGDEKELQLLAARDEIKINFINAFTDSLSGQD